MCGYSLFAVLDSEEKVVDSKEDLEEDTKVIPLPSETIVSSVWPECCICMDRKSNIVLIPCGHMCICDIDAEKLKYQNERKCPICREEVTIFQKVYM
jgi:hypothetical protein